jgi:hypothetical protein
MGKIVVFNYLYKARNKTEQKILLKNFRSEENDVLYNRSTGNSIDLGNAYMVQPVYKKI